MSGHNNPDVLILSFQLSCKMQQQVGSFAVDHVADSNHEGLACEPILSEYLSVAR